MADESQPAPGRATRLAVWACVFSGLVVGDAIREGLRPSLGFWQAVAVRVAPAAAALAALTAWRWFARRRAALRVAEPGAAADAGGGTA